MSKCCFSNTGEKRKLVLVLCLTHFIINLRQNYFYDHSSNFQYTAWLPIISSLIHGRTSREWTGAQFEPLPFASPRDRSSRCFLLHLFSQLASSNATQTKLSILNDCLFNTSIIFCIYSAVRESEGEDNNISLRRSESVPCWWSVTQDTSANLVLNTSWTLRYELRVKAR